ncbi:MAG: BspA family leucine-rich repeat surface protein [Lachnospiraceae bacterium]|nr:BspA family leucine-rich repeat surface protein [Lachnospiraceae bacterium]
MVGIVNLYDAKGKEKTLIEEMRLNSGHRLTTGGATPGTAKYGTTVTIQATPTTGYAIATYTVTVTDASNVTVTATQDATDAGKYTFVMPDKAVTVAVTATFGKAVTGVTLNRSSYNVMPGVSFDLTASVLPADAANQNVTWQIGDESVATIVPNGLTASVTGVATGTTTVTVTTEDGNKTATCNVKVLDTTIPTIDRALFVQKVKCNGYPVVFSKANALPASNVAKYEVQDTSIDANAPKVYVWKLNNTPETGVYTVRWYSEAYNGKAYLPENMEGMFSFNVISTMRSVDFTGLDASRVTTMKELFKDQSNLRSVTFGADFDTSNVTDMSHMFENCSYENISFDLTGFNTSNVTDMSYMFATCYVNSIDVGSFNTSRVTDMNHMFYNASGLKTIYVTSSWDVSNVAADSTNAFASCSALRGGNNTSGYGKDHTYARIDGENGLAGCFTARATGDQEVIISNTTAHGTVTTDVTPALYAPNSTVTLTVTPEDGYRLQTLIIKRSTGENIADPEWSGNNYYFKMPYVSVTVSAVFVANSNVLEVNSSTAIPPSQWFDNGVTLVRITESMSFDVELTVTSKTIEILPGVTFTISNNMALYLYGTTINNYGTIDNHGTLSLDLDSIFNNYSAHTLNNYGTIINNGTFVNGDGGENDGRLNNFDGAEIINNGVIINNEGSVVNNEGDIEGNDIVGDGEINDDTVVEAGHAGSISGSSNSAMIKEMEADEMHDSEEKSAEPSDDSVTGAQTVEGQTTSQAVEVTVPDSANATTGSDEENSDGKTESPDADIPDEQEESAET